MDKSSLFGVPTPPVPSMPMMSPVSLPDISRIRPQVEDGRLMTNRGKDILGFLGDFLLTRLKMEPRYQPAKQRKQLDFALQGFDQDPEAALSRVSKVDPKYARALRDQMIDNKRLENEAADREEARRLSNLVQQSVLEDRMRKTGAGMLTALSKMPEKERAQKYPLIRQRLTDYGNQYGIDVSSELPEQYDPAFIGTFIGGSVSPAAQETQDYREASLEERRQARINRPGPAPKAPTNVQTYTDESGHKVTVRSDGTIIKSPTKVRENTNTTNDPPREGERVVKNGKIYVWRNGRGVLQK